MTYETAGTVLIAYLWFATGFLMVLWTMRANWWETVEGSGFFTLALSLNLFAGSVWMVRALGPYPGHRWVVFFAVLGINIGVTWLIWLLWRANRRHRVNGSSGRRVR